MPNLAKLSCLLLAATLLGAPVASAEELAGAPMGYGPAPDEGPQPARHMRREGGECYAQVRYPAAYAPPPSGPEYVWTQAAAPPGAPGPVWCLTVTRFSGRPVQVAPERLGWIKVLCADDVTPDRVARLQRRLHERGLYRGEIDGRYDRETAKGVVAFQHERHIEHRGYLSYRTMAALDEGPSPCCTAAPAPPPCCAPAVQSPCCEPAPPPPRVIYWRRPTTFERGFVGWPGKSAYW